MSPSPRERVVRRIALFLSSASAVALGIALVTDVTGEPAPLAGALVAALAAAIAARTRAPPPLEIAVDAGGALLVRSAGDADGAERRLRCVYAAPWLITLRSGTIWVRVWPDSLPGNAFRRFWVHIRWSQGRHPADRTAPVRSR